MNRVQGCCGAAGALSLVAFVSACSAPGAHRIEIRSAENGYSTVSGSLDKARALLTQAQYGLAIDEFRKSLRDNPEQVGAVEGLALCYDLLGRYELSDRYYQQALALAPREERIYRNYVASLSRQGRQRDAANLVGDLRAMQALAADPLAVAANQPGRAVMVQDDRLATPRQGQDGESPPNLSSPPIPEGPHIVRDSLGEVRLITLAAANQSPRGSVAAAVGQPHRAGPALAQRLPMVPAQRVVLATRVVNAVGARGLATHFRNVLAQGGWQGLERGDARFRLIRSRVLFPPERREEAMRIVAALPAQFRAVPSSEVNRIVILVGRDAVQYLNKQPARRRG
ncbi:MAG: LytR C-terminal domain-containing protein [Sphingomonas sp.]|jgi:hypothetical protein